MREKQWKRLSSPLYFIEELFVLVKSLNLTLGFQVKDNVWLCKLSFHDNPICHARFAFVSKQSVSDWLPPIRPSTRQFLTSLFCS